MISHASVRMLVLVALLAPAIAPAAEPVLDTEEQEILYALGLAMSQNLKPFALTVDEVSLVQAGLADGVLGNEPRVALETVGPKIDSMLRARLDVVAEQEKVAGKLFLAEAAAQDGAVTTDSGMIYVDLAVGSGEAPDATSIVKLHYHGTLRDGTVFDSSRIAAEPATIPMAQMPPCMREGVSSMLLGGKRKVYCPPSLAYGDEGRPPMIPPAAVLVLEMELMEITEPAPAAETPAEAHPEQPVPLP